MTPASKPRWQQAAALVSLGAGGAVTGFSLVPGMTADAAAPPITQIRLLALKQAAQAQPGDSRNGMLRAAIVNVAGYYLKLAATRSPAQMEALIWQRVSSDGADHGPSCAAFASLTLELAAQVVGQQSWVTGGSSYPWPLPEWADVRVDPNPASLQITSVLQDAREQHRWHSLGDGYQPQPGDWVMFDGHVEVITSYAAGALDTIGADSEPGFTVNAHHFGAPFLQHGVIGFVDNGNLRDAPAPDETAPGNSTAGKSTAASGREDGPAKRAAPAAPGAGTPAPAEASTAGAGQAAIPGMPSGGSAPAAGGPAAADEPAAAVSGGPRGRSKPPAAPQDTAPAARSEPSGGSSPTAHGQAGGGPASASGSQASARPARSGAKPASGAPAASQPAPGPSRAAPQPTASAGGHQPAGTAAPAASPAGHAGAAPGGSAGMAASADVPGDTGAPGDAGVPGASAPAAPGSAAAASAAGATAAVPGLSATVGQATAAGGGRPPAASPSSGQTASPGAPASAGRRAAPAAAARPAYGRHHAAPAAPASPETSTQQSFIAAVAPGAIAAQRRYGVPAAVTIAQAIDESGWGQSSLAARDHNLFGIKGIGPAGSDRLPTSEFVNGQYVRTTASFRVYRSFAESIDDHGRLLATSGYYRKAMGYKQNPNAFAASLTGVYATDPDYGAKIISLMSQYDLYRFDATGQAPAAAPSAPPAAPADPAGAAARAGGAGQPDVPGMPGRPVTAETTGLRAAGIPSPARRPTGIQATGTQATGIQTTDYQTTGIQTTGIQTTGIQTTGAGDLDVQTMSLRSVPAAFPSPAAAPGRAPARAARPESARQAAPPAARPRRPAPSGGKARPAKYRGQVPQSVATAFLTTARLPLLREEPLYRDVAGRSGIRWELLAACDWMQCRARPRYSPVHGEKLGTVNGDGTVYRTRSEALEQCAEDLGELAWAVYRIDVCAPGRLSVLELANVFAAFRWGGLLRLHHTSAMEFPYSVAGLTDRHLGMRWPNIADPNAPDKPGARFRMPFGAVPVVLGLDYPALA